MYEAKYPSRGDPKLARHVIDLLTSAGIRAEGVKRGLDHGVWAGFHVGESYFLNNKNHTMSPLSSHLI